MSSISNVMSNVDDRAISGIGCPCCGKHSSRHWLRVPNRVTHWMQIPDISHGAVGGHDLLRCSACTHVWTANPPAPDELSLYYGEQYHRAVGTSGEMSPKRWNRQLQAILKYKTGGDILDIGCSSGGFLSCLTDGKWRLHGIEADRSTAERAHALTGADVFAGDILEAGFPPNSFDVITCSDVLEHLYDPREVLLKVYDWLKPGGIFYVFVPNIMSWEARIFGSYWVALDVPRHLQHFSKQSLADMAKSVNLRQMHLVTPPGSYLEHNFSILLDDLLRKVGVKRATPVNLTGDAGIGWRVVRKAFRLSVEALYSRLASFSGAAVSIQAVFQKDSKTA